MFILEYRLQPQSLNKANRSTEQTLQ